MDIEWLILADAAQVVGNKLNLIGGGWDRLSVAEYPMPHAMGLAMSIQVPWNQTNERHSFEIEITSEDAQSVAKAGGTFEVGRAAGAAPGQDQRIQFAVNVIMQLAGPGTFVVLARLDDEEKKRVTFTVVGSKQPAVNG